MLAFRTGLQAAMGWTQDPHMMLRLGWPPDGKRAPLTRRRVVGDVLRIL